MMMRCSLRQAGALAGLVVLVLVIGGCGLGDFKTRPLTEVERQRAFLCDQLIGVERLGCIQETAGRPGSPYDAAGRPVATR